MLDHDDRGSGPAIMLVHGFPLDRRIFDGVAATLAARHRVVAPDLPGFGKSRRTGTLTMDAMADELIELAESLHLGKFVLAGLSMGGYVAQAVVRRRPELLRGLVLIDTKAAADDEAGRAGRDTMAAAARERGTPAVVEQMLPKMLHPAAYADRPPLVERLRQIMLSQDAETLAQASLAMRDRPDFAADLGRLPCPLLVVVGDADQIAPVKVAEQMSRAAPGSQLSTIIGAGHLTTMERAAEVASAIGRFVDGLT